MASMKFCDDGVVFLVPLLSQLLLLLLVLLSNYSTLVGAAQHVGCVEKEKHALLEFKAGLVAEDSSHLPSWNHSNTDCCEWEGVNCNKQSGRVEMLHLSGDDQLILSKAEISASLMELQHLQYLNLSLNQFQYSPIPEFFGSLSNLQILDLHSSSFGGRIPINLATLSHLQYLDLSGNFLEGTIPHQLGNLSHLRFLDLSETGLVGTIPHQLGSLSNLHELYLGFNLGGLEIDDKGGQWLSNLTALTHLDLSLVLNLNYSHASLQMIVMLPKLEQLKLSGCDLSDVHLLSLPPNSMLNSSTTLVVLDLSVNSFTSSMIFQWVFNVTSKLAELDLHFNLLKGPIQYLGKVKNPLQHLDLSFNQLQGGILKSLRDICTLRSLHLARINLDEDISTILLNLSGCARYSLQELNLSDNKISGTLSDLSMFPSLRALYLSLNLLSGKMPVESDRLPSKLQLLEIESNSIEGGIPKSFGNLCTLHSLYLSNNNLDEELPVIINHLSVGCTKYSLQELTLAGNRITGTIPDMSNFHSLEELDLSNNLLNGKIPENIRLPSQLIYLNMNTNNLKGVISDSHFVNMSLLLFVDFSYNSLAFIFSENWVPPFQLQRIHLNSCKLGPNFPKWLQTQNRLDQLDISNAGISDAVPMWFWAQMLKSDILDIVNISYNNLTGTILNFQMRLSPLSVIDMTSNQFGGSIPPFFRSAASVYLSQNRFSTAHALLCSNTSADGLGILDLSKNLLSEHLPDCWSQFKALEFLDFSDNTLLGEVPFSMGSLLQLKVLMLRNNSFTGKLPISLKNCKNLVMIDVGENRLSGPIPSWLGIMGQQLRMLSLRKNNFSGSLPRNLCYLTNLQLLDFSFNNLSGQILKCLKNFTAMSQKSFSTNFVDTNYYGVQIGNTRIGIDATYDLIALLTWKGAKQIFKNNKLILKSIDLSSNQLTGDIPKEIGNLVELVSLNLSRNNLTGQIPSEIGRLNSLDFLDLSRNHFIGSIPPSFAQIDWLSVLDLSYNNLSGSIPIGTQLQSFDATSYEGNTDLCGKSLDKKCPGDEQELPDPKTVDKSGSEDKNSIYLSAALGFITGLWGLLGSLLLNRTWRHAYILFLNNLIDRIYVIMAVNVAKFQRRLRNFLDSFVRVSPED